ncbi:MAG TPA: hypothetical protein VNV25_25415 [Gemmatimonadaceae bacterium]|jgi:hypothetical protein|nr:hypothetical protein [Gemmatimonadaceae bacterium]
MKAYVAGAWVEQHQRSRPMIAKLREAGIEITCDWTQAEGDVCACGHHRSVHYNSGEGCKGDGLTIAACSCLGFNGIGSGGDSLLTDADRRKYAQADLDGVLAADIVWLLAANDRGACGSWVELGAALVARQMRAGEDGGPWPLIVVSGPKCKWTIFTELADRLFETDEEALAYVVGLHRGSP